MTKCLIIGSGASALAACYQLLKNQDNDITIITADEELGKKYLVTGNGRCNIGNVHAFNPENSCYVTADNFVAAPFSPKDKDAYFDYLTAAGLDLYEDEDGRLYPFSFSAVNVQKLLAKLIIDRVKVLYSTTVTSIDYNNRSVCDKNNFKYAFDKLVIAVGGISSIRKNLLPLDLKKINQVPALTAMTPNFTWPKRIIGQKAKGTLYVKCGDQVYEESGELLFKEKELTGIMIYNASLLAAKDEEIAIDFTSYNNQKVKNSSSYLSYLPHKIAGCVHDLPIADGVMRFKARVSSFDHAQVMKGGVLLEEINWENMSLKRYKDIYLIGEALDLAGLCGGYNLLAAIVEGLRVK